MKNRLLEYIKMVDNAQTVEDACRMAVIAIAEHTRFSNPSFFLVDPGGESLNLVAHVGFTPGTLSIPRGSGICWRSLETGEATIIENVTKEKDYLPGLEGSCCELNVPVIWRERKIGVFSIESKVPGAFLADDVRFANLFAAILGSVIVHLEAETRLSESLETLESTARYRALFLKISIELFAIRDGRAFLEKIVQVLSEVVGYAKVYLFLRETPMGPMWLRALRGKDIGEKAINDVLEFGKGLVGKAIRTGTAVFCNDTRSDPDFYMDDESTLSEAVLPIRFGDVLWGVLVVDEARPDAFSSADMDQMSILAGMIGVMLENIDQVRRIREDFALMEKLHRIIATAAGERNISGLCRETVRLLREHTKYNFVLISEVVNGATGESKIIASSVSQEGSEVILERQSAILCDSGCGLIGQTIRIRALLNTPDVRTAEHYVPLSPSTLSELDIPIVFNERLFGVLSIESDRISAFAEEDERVMSILANHLGTLWAHYDLLEKTEKQALQDPLTGLWNRRFIFDRIEAEASRCIRYVSLFSIVMKDLRNFKNINDSFGHPVGDRVLIETSSFFQRSLRECDVVARYGGDEFIILLPEADFAEASRMMERLEKDIVKRKLCVESVPVRFDCGIASSPADGRETRALIQTADERLYKVKAANKKIERGK
ncbi:MAG: diguanylate cyclase [Thermovirgaceae bacterium]|nr:diguanylate cyclase [Thermovirgaceae bacterium]